MAFGRSKILAVAMAAATGGPYLLSMTSEKADAPKKQSDRSAASAHDIDHAEDVPAAPGESAIRRSRVITHANLPLEGLPVGSLEEVLRFDVNPAWIMSRWGRVFTSPAEDELRGYRVALVTGTADFDLAGSLTYFFNTDQKLQRITFVGHTGNTLPIAALVERKFGLTRHKAEDPGLQVFQIKSSGRAVSELRLEPAAVVEAAYPHGRYKVLLWLERPADKHAMFSRDAGEYSDRLWPQR